jgi:transcriptional regulator with XRE-family HTH domain
MTEIAHSIDLNLPQKLRDKPYRQKFFWAESCAHIAKQLIDLRKRRGLNQKQVAEMTGTKQPAISRFEQADYQNRNFNTLLSIADVLDARVRVLIQPYEDILKEYVNEVADTAESGDAAELDEDIFSDSVVAAQSEASAMDVSGTGTAIIPMQSEGLAYPTVGSGAYSMTGYAFQGTIDPNTIALSGCSTAVDIPDPAIVQANTTAVLFIAPLAPAPRSGMWLAFLRQQ